MRVLAPAFIMQSLLFGAGSAWTIWAQSQVGAIKRGPPLLATLDLTFDVMLQYAGRMVAPLGMSISYIWVRFPSVSLRGVCGALLVLGLVAASVWLATSPAQNRRLAAFGILWYLISYLPVSNLVPTSVKMADRYQFVPSAGAILIALALLWGRPPGSPTRSRQAAACLVLALLTAGYTFWSYERTRVW